MFFILVQNQLCVAFLAGEVIIFALKHMGYTGNRKVVSSAAGLLAAISIPLVSSVCGAIEVNSQYMSQWNNARPVRQKTNYIILHTTEATRESSLNSLQARGETHYVVDPAGRIYRIMDKARIATHAGKSLWNGKVGLDDDSVAIEVVGYHNKDITAAQYDTLRSLVSYLKGVYKIPDDHVLTHSMIAYSTPNKWFTRSHRGRKRCGMLFADPGVREKLGLSSKPAFDPDVQAGRVIVGDLYLQNVLYGRGQKTASSAPKALPVAAISESSVAAKAKDTPAPKKSTGAFKEIGRDGDSAEEVAGSDYNKKTTLYFMPEGLIKRGCDIPDGGFQRIPKKTLVLVGYLYAGTVTDDKSAQVLLGRKSTLPATYYLFPDGTIKSGSKVDVSSVPPKTMLFYRN